MLELMSYGLTGLAAVVVLAFCFAYSEALSPGQDKRSIESDECSTLATLSAVWRKKYRRHL
jgi:hypothetical protein